MMEEDTASAGADSPLTSELTPLDDLGVGSAIVTINQRGTIQSVDKCCCELFGYALTELVGENVKILIPQPYKEQHDNYIDRYNTTGQRKIIGIGRVVEAVRKDNTIFPIRLHVAEIPLAGEEKVFIGTMERLDDAAAVLTASMDGKIISSNRNCSTVFGYTPQDLVGQNLKMLMPNPYSDNHDMYIKDYRETGEEKVINQTRNVFAKHQDGTIFPVSLQVKRIKVGVVDLFKGRIEKIDHDIEAVFTLTASGIIRSCNHFFVRTMFGYAASELVGKHINLLIPEFTETISDPTKLKKKDHNRVGDRELTNSEGSLQALWRVDAAKRPCVVLHKDRSTFVAHFSVYKFIKDGETLFSARMKRLCSDDSESDVSSDVGSGMRGSGLTSGSLEARQVGDYIIVSLLGKGSYGRVLLARHKISGKMVAVKVMQKDLMDEAEVTRSMREVEILRKLDHPHIAKLYDVIETADRINIIMEYNAGGELLSYVKRSVVLSEEEARRLFLQLADAVDYCHKRHIVHRDIKHKNILLDDENNVKLIDFGLSNFLSEGGLRATFCGTPAYAAPEMILAQKYNGPEVDIWSMGVVLFSLVEGKFPFPNVSKIISGEFAIAGELSMEIRDLLSQMLDTDAKKRIDLPGVLAHPWCVAAATIAASSKRAAAIVTPPDSKRAKTRIDDSSVFKALDREMDK